MLEETRQRWVSCHQIGCSPYHPAGHVVLESRQVTPWKFEDVVVHSATDSIDLSRTPEFAIEEARAGGGSA